MGLKINVFIISVLLLFTVRIQAVSYVAFDVRTYGAISSEKVDNTQALLKAWQQACSTAGANKVFIPKGTYYVGKIDMKGPCMGDIAFEIQGTLKAHPYLEGDSWVIFQYINKFLMLGGGTLDGQGQIAWKKNNCAKDPKCKPFPISLRLHALNNSVIQDVALLNSKNFHVNILSCYNLEFHRLRVDAPENSLNTDGIHIGRSTGIKIVDTKIATGDDCISIGDGTHKLYITRVECGPGHGISVGSLGRYPIEQPVSEIYVYKCRISNTPNGIRIKSWPALYGNVASDLHFEDIVMDNVAHPILIDQMYCPWNQCNPKQASKVKISNVSFKNIRGTCSSPNAVQLICSSGIPCENVLLQDIDLHYIGNKLGPPKTEFINVKPKVYGKLNPQLASPQLIRRLMFDSSM